MPTISNDEVEALARRLLWEQIDRSAWHAGLTEEERTAAITAEMEAWWYLRAGEAASSTLGAEIPASEQGLQVLQPSRLRQL